MSNTIKMISNIKLKTKKRVVRCAARNCYNTSENCPHLNFFPFPKETTFAKIWANYAGRDDMSSKPNCVLARHSLCAVHFLDKYFDNNYDPKTVFRKDLHPIPTLFGLFQEQIKLETEIKLEEPDVEIIDVNTTGCFNTIPLQLPDDIRPGTEWGKMNYTEDVYEQFVTNPNVLNKPDASDRLILRDYCRLCAKQLPIASLIPIFGSNKFVNYGDMLQYILPGQIKKDDAYPKQICSKCISKLEIAYTTMKAFDKSNRILKNIFDKEAESLREENLPPVEGVSELLTIPEKKTLITPTKSNDEKKEESVPPPQQPNEEYVKKNVPETVSTNDDSQTEEEIQIKHQCLVCLKLFNNETEIRNHSNLTHSETNYKFRIVKVKLCKKKEKPPPVINTETPALKEEPKEKPESSDKFYYMYKHQCLKCYKMYRRERHLIHHAEEMHPELEKPVSKLIKVRMKYSSVPSYVSTTRYECLICHTQHRNMECFLKHSNANHPESNADTATYRILKSRKYRNHGITCLRCTETFDTVSKYKLHMIKHAIYKCEPCGITFKKFYKFRSHKRTHQKVLNCIECNQAFTKKRELSKHEETHKKLESVECNVCNEKFSSKFDLRKHKRCHESALCNICGKLFSSQQNLKCHMQIHLDTRPFKCRHCDKSFKTSANLSKHKECHEKVKKYVCQICGKQFRTKGTMKQHLLVHKNTKTHACDICGVKFTRRGNMVKHMERHNIINKVYKCQICLQQYNDYQNLVFHSCTPNIEHRCEECEKVFLTSHQLELHKPLHDGDKPFQCVHCSKTFLTKQGLSQHKVCLTDLGYQCTKCDKSFLRPQSLRRHKKRHEKQDDNSNNS